MTSRATARTTAVLAAATLALMPATASAQSTSKVDKRGDAPRAVDITRVNYTHTENRFGANAAIPSLNRKKLFNATLQVRAAGKPGKAYLVELTHKAGKTTRSLSYGSVGDPSKRKKLSCQGITLVERSNRMRVSVPKRCLTGTPLTTKLRGKVKLIANLGPGHDSYDETTGYSKFLGPS